MKSLLWKVKVIGIHTIQEYIPFYCQNAGADRVSHVILPHSIDLFHCKYF